jgi:flagellar biogenesis protein FliO
MQDVSVLALLGRLVVSLAVVIGLMVVAGRLLGGRSRLGGGRKGASVEVLGRHALGRNASVTVVKAGGRGLVLGVTERAITVLAEVDPAEFEVEADAAVDAAAPPRPAVPGWGALLDAIRERTVRR